METITILELNEIFDQINGKLGGIWLNEKRINWPLWLERCKQMGEQTEVGFVLAPGSSDLHIFLKDLPPNPFIQF